MSKLVDIQLKRNDCGISAVKTVCNVLDVDITRDIIEDSIYLDEEGASLESLNKFFTEYGFKTNYKLFDFNSVNGNQAELNKMFPCIVAIKKKVGLHYVVVNSLKNYKFEILDPKQTRPYKMSLDEFKSKIYYSSSALPYVDVEQAIQIQVKEGLRKYKIKLKKTPTEQELAEMFNKLVYFSYIEEKFGFKDKAAAKGFLEDLIFRQELTHIPKHFEEIKYKREKIRIKAPVFLSVQKTEETQETGDVGQKNGYWRLFKSIASIRGLWYIFLGSALLASFISYISVFINQILIDHVLPSYQLDTLRLFAVGVGLFFLINLAFKVYRKFISIHLSNAFDRYFMGVFDKKLSTYSIRYLQSYKRGDLTERLRDAMKMKTFFTRYFSSIVVDVLIATSSLFFLFMINWQLSLLVVFVLLLFGLLFYIFTPIITNLERQRYTRKATFTSKFIEKIDGLQSIKALGLESYSSQQILSSMEDLIQINTKSKYVGLLNSVLTTLITSFASLILLVLTAREMIVFNSITLGMIITFLALSGKIFSAFSNLLDKNLSLQEHRVILDRFFDFDEHKFKDLGKEKETDGKQDYNIPAKKSKTIVYNKITNFEFKELALKDVKFSYNQADLILKNINFNVRKGEKIMIRGRNGSGKSTLCKIMGMLYDPSEGEVLLNDSDISLFDKKRLRKKIIFVSGEDLLFNETFMFNVSFGRKIDMELLIEYSKVLGLYDFIQKKPEKFDFMIYENGKNLSTGQRKKVLLLRALMTSAELIILDEIFNGLDKESKAMAESLLNFIHDRAFIIISHMPSEKIFFDKKYNIKNGLLLDEDS